MPSLFKNLIICTIALVLITACRQSVTTAIKKDSTAAKAVNNKKDTIVKKVYPLTDSGQLMLHLDSLARPPFPYLSDGRNYNPLITISLVAFKSKKLFNIPLQLIPRSIGGDFLDHGGWVDENGILPDSIRETFNLVDTITYKAEGVLVATTPKFAVVDLDGTLVTLSYNVVVIDAIRISEGGGNNHWQIWRNTTIDKDLTMTLHQWYTRPEYPQEAENVEENWFIDADGHIKKQAVQPSKKRHKHN